MKIKNSVKMLVQMSFVIGTAYLFSITTASADIWSPKPGTGPLTTNKTRLVVYGDQWSRHNLAGHGGIENRWRHPYNSFAGQTEIEHYDYYDFDFYDANGNGITNQSDGYLGYFEFSETERLGMGVWPTVGIYPTPVNWKFVGGVTWNVSDSEIGDQSFCLEQGMNADHRLRYPESAEDHPLQAQQYSGNPNSRVKSYWAIIWNKEDFLNGADEGTVSIGPDSRFSTYYNRYWVGVDVIRMIIKDSGQYYSHEQCFNFQPSGTDTIPYHFIMNPNDVKWAPYNPNGYDLRFETNQAFNIDASSFTNIQAVGHYIAKDTPRPGMMHTKWYNFEADANITKKSRPSEHIDMAEVAGSGGVQDFYMSTCEVPYKLWYQMYRYADSCNYPNEGRYNFDKDGDMGSMQYGTNSHNNQEPAVNFTIYDMAAWCNALSEKECKEPVFYGDPACTVIFKYTNIATRATEKYETRHFKNPEYTYLPDQPLYVKWAADGYRPPTPAEWEQAYGGQGAGSGAAWIDSNSDGQTHDVGTKTANGNGIFDMAGNAWEFTWIHGDVYVPGASNSHMVVGGGFHYPNDPRTAVNSASPYGDMPFKGRYDIGLRLVRRDSGLAKPAIGSVLSGADNYQNSGIHKWKFSDSYKTVAVSPAPSTNNILEMASIPSGTFFRAIGDAEWDEVIIHPLEISKFEISYEKWLKVYFWGIENGYVFDTDGCMGSMRWWDFTHTDKEPVVALPWHDMLVWCNALSAMEGLAPIYYTNDARTIEYKNAYKLRGIKIDVPELVTENTGYSSSIYREPWLFANWANNGYRLLTLAEWEYAARAGLDKQTYQWGSDSGEYDNYVWDINNSDGYSHPVGQLNSNAYGLYDMQGNAAEALWSNGKGNDPALPYNEDLNNPKGTRYGGWQTPKEVNASKSRPNVAGFSFFWARSKSIAGSIPSDNNIFQNHNASDIGFRVAKCESNVHPTNGIEDLVIVTLLDYDTNDFDKLQGRCAQGNLLRDGQYPQKGVASNAVVKWTFDTDGPVKSSPVVVENVVYTGGGDGFYALDYDSGAELWKISVPEGVESSACVVDDVVYFGANDKKIYAVYTNGTVKWSVWSHSTLYNRKPIYAPLAVAYDTVFVVVGSTIQGFSTDDGSFFYDPGFENHWERAAISMNENYFTWRPKAGSSHSRGYIKDGKHVSGSTSSAGSYCRSSAAMRNEVSYCPAAGGTFVGGDRNYAGYTAMIITNDTRAYFLDYVYARQADDFLPEEERTGCFSSPGIWNDQLILGMDSGMIYSYALADGECKTNFFKSSGPIRSPITVSTLDDTVYCGSWDDNIYGLDGDSGDKRWEIKTGGNVESAACVYDEKIYVGCDDGLIYCIEESTELGIVANPNPMSVDEDSSKTLFVKLSRQPSGNVDVEVSKLSGDTDITVSGDPVTLNFTTANWDEYREVTVNAADDTDSDNGSAVIRCSASGLGNIDVTVNEIDNDQKMIVSATEVDVPEGGTATFNVRLNADIGLPLTVSVARQSGDSDISVDNGSSLDFTSGNYDEWQTVTLKAGEDADMIGGSAVIRCSEAGLDNVDVIANEVDNDIPRIVASVSEINVWEGSNATFGLSINIDPMATVTVSVENAEGDADISVSMPTNFVFTSGNFSTEQNVTLAAAPDSDKINGVASIKCYSEGIQDDVFVTATEFDTNVPAASISFQDGVYPDASYAGTIDSYMHGHSKSNNYGDGTVAYIGRNGDRRVCLKWDLTDVPSTATIVQATITLTRSSIIDGDDGSFNLLMLKRPWTEMGITFNKYDGTTDWQIEGADGADDRGTVSLGVLTLPSSGNGGSNDDKVTVNLNNDGLGCLQNFVTNSSANNGFMFLETENTGNVRNSLYMRENGTDSYNPKLNIVYKLLNHPKNPGIVINNDDLQTENKIVNLVLYAEKPTPEDMQISENINFVGAVLTNYMTDFEYELSDGYGTKTVYAKFFSDDGGESEVTSDSIQFVPEPGMILWIVGMLECWNVGRKFK